MNDKEKNRRYLNAIGIEAAKALYKESGEEAVYPGAIVGVWSDDTIDEGLEANRPVAEIAEAAEVSIRTVLRRKRQRLGLNDKSPVPEI
jgi:hypothetical protein